MQKNISDKINKIRFFPWLIKKVRTKIPSMFAMLICGCSASFLTVRFTLRTKGIIDSAVSSDAGSLKSHAVYAVLIAVLVCLFYHFARLLSENIRAELDRDLKREYLSKIFNSDYSSITAFHSGDLVNRLNSDIESICSGVTSALNTTGRLITSLIASVIVINSFSSGIMIALLVSAFILGLLMAALRIKAKNLRKDISEINGKTSGFFQEMISNLLIVKGLDAEDETLKRADELLQERYSKNVRLRRFSQLIGSSMNAATYTIQLLAVILCAKSLMAGAISFGTLTAITQLAGKLESVFASAPSMAANFYSMLAASERLCEIDSIKNEETYTSSDINSIYDNLHSVEVCGVDFSYEDNKVLNQLSASFAKGSMTVITGSSGIGKSTLFKLLLGLYRPDSGSAYFLLNDRTKIELGNDTRKMFAYVPQGNLIISGTLRDNLLLANPNACEEDIQKAAETADMLGFIAALPFGLDTVLGEKASGISEGQAQRLAVARAVLSDAPILLLDEITSSLDSDTEKKLLDNIRHLENRTCIVITHRPQALETADYHIDISNNYVNQSKLK